MSRKIEGRAGTGRLRGWDLPRGSRAVGLRVQVIPDLFLWFIPREQQHPARWHSSDAEPFT